MSVAHESDGRLFDDFMQKSAEQWLSVAEECMNAGYYLCQLGMNTWQLLPLSVLGDTEH